MSNLLADKLIKNDEIDYDKWDEYRYADIRDVQTSSTKLIQLLGKRNYVEADDMILKQCRTMDPIDVTTLWASIFDGLYVNEYHAIGALDAEKLQWLHECGLAPNDNQKVILIPYLCLSVFNNDSGFTHSNCRDAVTYLYEQGYPIFDIDGVFQNIRGCKGFHRQNTKKISKIVHALFRKTFSVVDDPLVFSSIAYHLFPQKERNNE